MSLALTTQNVHHDLRTKRLYVIAKPTNDYQGPTTAVPTTAFTQAAPGAPLKLTIPPAVALSGNITVSSVLKILKEAFTQAAAGDALLFTVKVGDALSGNVTFSTSGGTGAGSQVVNLATYTNLASAVGGTATTAAAALATALTNGALGTASGATYTGTVTAGAVSIATTVGAEVLSVTASTAIETITQVVNTATYTNLSSTTAATATAAAVALALALTNGALGGNGATYTGTITGGVLSLATSVATEILSVTASALVYTIAGGDTLDLTAITTALGQSDANIGYPGVITNFTVISAPAGYPVPTIVKGTTLKNWRLRVYSAIDTELATGTTYPADILASSFVLMFEGPKGQM